MMLKGMLVILLGMTFLVDGLLLYSRQNDQKMDVNRDVRPVKRHLWQFHKMIKCATGRSAWDYNNYGNWCGPIGSGIPVDGVDRCCKALHSCYDNNKSCTPNWPQYAFSMTGSYPSCSITCNTSSNQCLTNTCNCDQIAAECFARNTYNTNNKKKIWG